MSIDWPEIVFPPINLYTTPTRRTKMAYPIRFDATPEEADLIAKIADRAEVVAAGFAEEYSKRDAIMDITAAHRNGTPLRLQALLEANDYEFAHDVLGIRRHLNRRNGHVEGCFLPRYAA